MFVAVPDQRSKLPETTFPSSLATLRHTALWMFIKNSNKDYAFTISIFHVSNNNRRTKTATFSVWRDKDDVCIQDVASTTIWTFEEWLCEYVIGDKFVSLENVVVTDDVTDESATLAEIFARGMDVLDDEEDKDYSATTITTCDTSDSVVSETDETNSTSMMETSVPVVTSSMSLSEDSGEEPSAAPDTETHQLSRKQKQALHSLINCEINMYGTRKHNGTFCNFQWDESGQTGICKIVFHPGKYHVTFSTEQSNKSHLHNNVAHMCRIAERPCVILVGDWCNGANDVKEKLQNFSDNSTLSVDEKVMFHYLEGDKKQWAFEKNAAMVKCFKRGDMCLVMPCKYDKPIERLNAFLETHGIENVCLVVDEGDTLADRKFGATDTKLVVQVEKLLTSVSPTSNRPTVSTVNIVSATLIPTMVWLKTIDPDICAHAHIADMEKLKANGFSVGDQMKLEFALDARSMTSKDDYGWQSAPVRNFFQKFVEDSCNPQKQGCLMLYNTTPYVKLTNKTDNLQKQALRLWPDRRCTDDTICIVASGYGVQVTSILIRECTTGAGIKNGFFTPSGLPVAYVEQVLACKDLETLENILANPPSAQASSSLPKVESSLVSNIVHKIISIVDDSPHLGIRVPICIFTYNLGIRCISYRSKMRVVTHIAVHLSQGKNTSDVRQALMRPNGWMADEVRRNNGFDTVVVAATKEDFETAMKLSKITIKFMEHASKGRATPVSKWFSCGRSAYLFGKEYKAIMESSRPHVAHTLSKKRNIFSDPTIGYVGMSKTRAEAHKRVRRSLETNGGEVGADEEVGECIVDFSLRNSIVPAKVVMTIQESERLDTAIEDKEDIKSVVLEVMETKSVYLSITPVANEEEGDEVNVECRIPTGKRGCDLTRIKAASDSRKATVPKRARDMMANKPGQLLRYLAVDMSAKPYIVYVTQASVVPKGDKLVQSNVDSTQASLRLELDDVSQRLLNSKNAEDTLQAKYNAMVQRLTRSNPEHVLHMLVTRWGVAEFRIADTGISVDVRGKLSFVYVPGDHFITATFCSRVSISDTIRALVVETTRNGGSGEEWTAAMFNSTLKNNANWRLEFNNIMHSRRGENTKRNRFEIAHGSCLNRMGDILEALETKPRKWKLRAL